MISSDKTIDLPLESSIWIDSTGIIYFIRSDKVRKYEPCRKKSSKIITLPTPGLLNDYYSLGGDSVGRLYITDTYNHMIRTLDLNDPTAPLVPVAGNGASTQPENGALATATGIGFPVQIWVNAKGHFFFADYEACNVYQVNEEGRIYKILGTGSYGELKLGSSSIVTQIGAPVGIVGDASGNIYVAANNGDGVIYKLSEPVNYEYKIEYFAGMRSSYSLQGSYRDGLLATSTHFTYIASIGIDSYSNIYVEDGGSKVIRKIDGVSGMTRIIVDKEIYSQFDCDYEIDDDNEPTLRGMYVNAEGGIFIYRCSLVHYLSPHHLELRTSRSLSSASPAIGLNTIFFTLVGILILLLVISFRKMIKTY
eukprot:gene3410-3634_t